MSKRLKSNHYQNTNNQTSDNMPPRKKVIESKLIQTDELPETDKSNEINDSNKSNESNESNLSNDSNKSTKNSFDELLNQIILLEKNIYIRMENIEKSCILNLEKMEKIEKRIDSKFNDLENIEKRIDSKFDNLENIEKRIDSKFDNLEKNNALNLEKIEKGLLSINTDLINQNIKMSDIAFGKLPEPSPLPNENGSNNSDNSSNNSDNSSNENSIKELYFYEQNNSLIVYGPGTYDNKDKLKKFGEWNGINKNWKLTISRETLFQEFKNITEKEKS